MKKAFGYLRVSGQGQVDGDGFPRQRAAIEAYAKTNTIQIVQFFEERGVRGSEYDRPAWKDMLVALLSDGVKTVIVEKVDRLARDLMVQETFIGDLKRKGFEIVSTAEPDLCSSDPTRVLIRQVMGAVAEYDRKNIVSRMRAARDRASQKLGRRIEGRKPFGQTDTERKTLSRMRDLQAQGVNFLTIAKKLNAEGRRTQTGSKWFATSVSRTLARIA